MIYCVADVETTGLKHWWHDVISCGLVIKNEMNETLATFDERCKPWMPQNFNPETTKVHGFTLHDVMQFQPPELMARKMLHFLAPFRTPGQYLPFVSHDLNDFDFNFIESFFIKCDLQFSSYKIFNRSQKFSTILMARERGYENNQLNNWAIRLGKSFKHHTALDDAMMCAEVYNFLKQQRILNATESDSQQAKKFHAKRITKTDDGSKHLASGDKFTLI